MIRSSGLVTWLVKHVVSPPLDRASFRLTGGRLRASAGRPVLLLASTGHRTGRPRTTPVFYVRDGEDVVVCNVRPPGERANPWPKNLEHEPEIQVTYDGRTRPVTARRATEAEIDRLWPKLVDVWPLYAAYFAETNERHVFVLSPRPSVVS